MKRISVPLTVLLAALLVAVVAGLATRESGNSALAPSSGAAALQRTFVDVYQRVSPSVVQIQTAGGLGSGIVFDTKGNIVTNNHVVDGDTAFTVTTSTGKQLKATLVGTFPNDDLAVIRVPSGSGLKPAIFAQSSKLQVGQIAMAIGNPLGLQSSVTQGIVSALNRQAPEGNGFTLQNAIQTSAPINPGNSGGALVDIQGRVIGIPTLAAADSQLGGAAAGIGFAIPSDTVKNIAAQIVQSGKVVNSHRAYIGVRIGDTGSGVYVGSVEAGGPAARAGLQAGDVITALNGQATPSSDDLGQVLAGLKPGQTVQLKVMRQTGATATLSVTLGELPAN
jgi:putative serine protease PepD